MNLARARKVLREVSVIAVLVLGALAVELIARGLRGMTSRAFDVRRGGEVAVAFRFLAYVALALVVLALVGVPGTTSSRAGRSRGWSSASRGPPSCPTSSGASCS